MKRVIGYVSVFVVVVLISAVVHIPASLVVKYAPLPRALQLQGVSGTLWQGSAEQVSWQRNKLGAVQWDWQWSALLGAKAQAAVRFGRGSDLEMRGKGVIGYGLSGAFARDVVVSMPAQQVVQTLQLPVPVSAEGQVELTVRDYQYGQPWCSAATGNLAWTPSQIGSPLGELQLDRVMAEVHCQDNVVTVNGSQNSAQVSAEFSAELNAARRYQAKGWFKPGAEFPPRLSEQLNLLPRPDGQGRYQFTRQGRL